MIGHSTEQNNPPIPFYLHQYYSWAYLNPRTQCFFDHSWIVSSILWGNYGYLVRTVLGDIPKGALVLQIACVYGNLSLELAKAVGKSGCLDIIDIVPLQVEHCREKVADFPNVSVLQCDAAFPPLRLYDRICCFFLLHEVPEDYKTRIVRAVLERLSWPHGQAIFVDYHRPSLLHPLRPVMWCVNRLLEPYATALWQNEISSYARPNDLRDKFSWHKELYFGALYQKVLVTFKEKISVSHDTDHDQKA